MKTIQWIIRNQHRQQQQHQQQLIHALKKINAKL